MIDLLYKKKLLLASKSPRRSDLLKAANIPFKVITCDWDETFDDGIDVKQVPQYLSYHKALHVRDQLKEDQIILTADTVVIMGNRLLGKPTNKKDAISTLTTLSDASHDVITGITVMSTNKTVNASCTSTVTFGKLLKSEINDYVTEYNPFDKAGSYGIQDWIGICKIKSIKGSYHNIMGLPTHIVYQILKVW
ncbi:MAG: Maf family nucleotide pyrophosphatase [Saprospiraceae bacterium]